MTPNFLRVCARVATATVLSVALIAASATAQTTRLDPRDYRGSNYFPGTTQGISNALNFLSVSNRGTYSPLQVEAELDEFAAAGFNVLRIFPSFYGWVCDPADYLANLDHFAKNCASRGLKIVFVLWLSLIHI